MSSHIALRVNGRDVQVPDDGASLLEVLRDRLGLRAVKDGCSPQGQCGCCTVLVDGQPRVACVTAVRRVSGRDVVTPEGLSDESRAAWGDAFCATGGSQCGFCTPGIVMRLEALRAKGTAPADRRAVDQALLAHLCRCTGWLPIHDAWERYGTPAPRRDLAAASRRAALEGGVPQEVGAHIALSGGGFADDTAPLDALVAVRNDDGWVVGETLTEARARAGKVQGRRSTSGLRWPIEVPPGDWVRTLRTTWVEPAYLEPDASWCAPGGKPVTPLANGGAFGGKVASEVGAVARRLADEHGRPVRVLYAREDVVRRGPKRPPLAAGLDAAGHVSVRVARTPGIAEAIAQYARRAGASVDVEEVDVAGPPTSAALRGAGWAEVAVLVAAWRGDATATVTAPNGATASARVDDDGVHVRVRCGAPLDEVVLRSYCIGASHMALGWVRSEGIAVDDDGVPTDLTIRSFGILRALDMPAVSVEIEPSDDEPVNGSDAVFAAVAAATWIAQGCPERWPVERGGRQ